MQFDIERRPRLGLQPGSAAAGAAGPVGPPVAAAAAAAAAAADGRSRLPPMVPTQQEED